MQFAPSPRKQAEAGEEKQRRGRLGNGDEGLRDDRDAPAPLKLMPGLSRLAMPPGPRKVGRITIVPTWPAAIAERSTKV